MNWAPDRYRLQLSLLVWRHGWIWPLAAASVVFGAVAWFGAAVPARHALAQAEEKLSVAMADQRRKSVEKRSDLGAVNGVANDPGQAPPLVDLLADWAIQARVHDVRWVAGDYREEINAKTGQRFSRVELQLSGTYPQLRRFCAELFRGTPWATLDRLAFTAEGQDGAVIAKVALTVWQGAPAQNAGNDSASVGAKVRP